MRRFQRVERAPEHGRGHPAHWEERPAWHHVSASRRRAACCRGQAQPAQGRRRKLHRHHHRVVRLLPLRDGRRAGVQQAVLPERRAADRHAAGASAPTPSASSPGRSAASSSATSATGSGASRCSCSSLLIMGVATFLIGCCRPTRRSASSAPILLVAAALRAGHRRRRRVGRRGADGRRARAEGPARLLRRWPQMGVPAGLLLSTVVFADRPERDHRGRSSWPGAGASRSCSAIVLVVVGLFIRLRLMESPAFKRGQGDAAPSAEMPIVDVVKHAPARRPDRDGHADRRERHVLHLHRLRPGLRRGAR